MIFFNREILLIFILTGLLIAQTEDSTSVISDQTIENLTYEPVTNNEEFNVIEYLEELQNNPVNINTADLTTLQKIPELDINYAKLIIQHRAKYGHFFSTNELFTIKGLPKHIIINIKPFISTSDPIKQNDNTKPANTSLFNFARINLRSRFSYNLNEKNDLLYCSYPGTKLRLYNRLTLLNQYGEAGILTEKDPGEKSYFDFISFHLFIKNLSFIQKAAIGDYVFEFGQGLVIWGPFGFSKTTDAVFPVKSRENTIRPYKGIDESRFFRGIGISAKYNEFLFSFFYSSHKLDGSIDTITGGITSLITSGYHRSNSELNSQGTLIETAWGGSVNYSYNNLIHLGVLYCTSKFSQHLSGSLLYTPQGNRFNYFSTSYEFCLNPSINLSGETAYDFKSIASLNTIEISFNKNFLFVSSIRNYPRNYNAIHGNSLSEQRGKVQNETGFYNGFKLQTNFGTFNFYYDQFKFPFGGYRFPISNAGEEFLLSYANTFDDGIKIKTNYKYENKDYLLSQVDQKSIARRGRNDIRVLITWDILREIKLKSITEYNTIRIRENHVTEEGILLSNSVLIDLIDNLKLSWVISFFRTDSFFSSVYEYDNNIGGLVRGEVLYGEGTKINIYLSYKMFKELTISAQYSEIIKPEASLVSPIYPTLTNNIILQMELSL